VRGHLGRALGVTAHSSRLFPALAHYDRTVKRVGTIGLIISFAVALAFDFPWTTWAGHSHWAKVGWIPFYSWPVSVPDITQNILLFMPAGVCAHLALGERARTRAVFLALPVSVLGEWTQLYGHSRFPSATDVSCNVLGTLAGVWLAGMLGGPRGRAWLSAIRQTNIRPKGDFH
jgi:glycopeptide antibiotics resistance protein